LTHKLIVKFVNEHIPGWSAKLSQTQYIPQRKLFGNVSWFGRKQKGSKVTVSDKRGNLVMESDSNDPYHRNSYTLMKLLDAMGTGSGTTTSTQDELKQYEWYNPFGLPTNYRSRHQ
jgi:hypothetical protein